MDNVRLLITCPCGLSRCLPEGLQEGESFNLVACLRCGQTIQGTLIGNRVECN